MEARAKKRARRRKRGAGTMIAPGAYSFVIDEVSRSRSGVVFTLHRALDFTLNGIAACCASLLVQEKFGRISAADAKALARVYERIKRIRDRALR
jgi:hypothetical protein